MKLYTLFKTEQPENGSLMGGTSLNVLGGGGGVPLCVLVMVCTHCLLTMKKNA